MGYTVPEVIASLFWHGETRDERADCYNNESMRIPMLKKKGIE